MFNFTYIFQTESGYIIKTTIEKWFLKEKRSQETALLNGERYHAAEVQQLQTLPRILTINRTDIKIMEFLTLAAVYLEMYSQRTSCKS